jgi:hypothetical protein
MLGSRPSLLSIIRVPNTKDRAANAVMGLRTGAIRAPESGTIDRSSQIATLHTARLSQQPVQNPLGLTSVPAVHLQARAHKGGLQPTLQGADC